MQRQIGVIKESGFEIDLLVMGNSLGTRATTLSEDFTRKINTPYLGPNCHYQSKGIPAVGCKVADR